MKRVLSTLIILAMALTAMAQKQVMFEYKGPDGNKLKYEITDNSKHEVMVTWPGKHEYSNPYEYENVIIPEYVENKGTNYTVVGIKGGFYRSKKLKAITIPRTIRRLSSPCQSEQLEIINISDLTTWCKCSTNANLFYPKTGLYLNGELVTNLVVPSTVNDIKCSFWGYRFLKSVVIPPSVRSICDFAFYDCRNLKSVIIQGNNMTDIGEGVFNRCVALTEIHLANSIKSIGKGAFQECKSLQCISLPNSLTNIPMRAFNECEALSAIIIPQKLKKIETFSFNRCKSLKTIDIPSSVISIGYCAFQSCSSLQEVNIKNPYIKIEERTFSWCKSLTTIKGLSEKSDVSPNAFLTEYGGVIQKAEAPPFSFEQYKKTFSYFATGKVEEAIAQWQKKGEFETNEQWKQRVNEANRDVEVKNQIEKIRQAYINKMTVLAPTPVIQTYDAEREIFPIKIGTETMYVKVPVIEAQQFKQNFKSDYIHTEYNIVNDLPAVVGRTCKVGDKVYATTNTYAKADDINTLALNLPPLEIDFGGSSTATAASQPKTPTDRTIDQDIPSSEITNANSFAVIIGNENYTMVPKVDYAKNDAQVFAEYCRKTLGLPAKNVRSYGDATYAMMMSAIKDIQEIAKAYNGNINVIFYYAGHGIPNESNRDSYLLPIDADGRQTDFCYPVSKLYQELGAMNAKKVVVFMDACFSGALRGNGMLMSARTVAIKPKTNAPTGNMIVMTAASGDETAFPYIEKGHGMFTYYLLKKLRDTKGNCTLGELGDYIKTNVQQESIVVNRKSQTPTLNFSPAIINSWKTFKLR